MPFEPLLFIGDAGDGDQFAFRICNRRTPLAEVYVWNHENDSRVWLATSLRSYLEGAIAGSF